MATQPKTHSEDSESTEEYDPWYKYGVAILYLEMGIAIFVTIYCLYLGFTGSGGIGH